MHSWLLKDIDYYLYRTRRLDEFGFVDDLYKTFLLRESDKEGKAVYANRLRFGEIVRRRLLYEFLSSPERPEPVVHKIPDTALIIPDTVAPISDVIVVEKLFALDGVEFVNNAYFVGLLRAPDRIGEKHYERKIRRDSSIGMKRAILHEILTSNEFVTLHRHVLVVSPSMPSADEVNCYLWYTPNGHRRIVRGTEDHLTPERLTVVYEFAPIDRFKVNVKCPVFRLQPELRLIKDKSVVFTYNTPNVLRRDDTLLSWYRKGEFAYDYDMKVRSIQKSPRPSIIDKTAGESVESKTPVVTDVFPESNDDDLETVIFSLSEVADTMPLPNRRKARAAMRSPSMIKPSIH
jgi:hypothetical protein